MRITTITLALLVAGLSACGSQQSANETKPKIQSKLEKFGSQQAFDEFIKPLLTVSKNDMGECGTDCVEAIADVASSPNTNESITNNQESGVDEGGLVKNYKDHLIILRQGSLSSVKIAANGAASLQSRIEVKPANLGNTAWYDELLIHDNIAIVIGYRWHHFQSYSSGLVEIDFFNIGSNGTLTRGASYFVESSDYFSWKNYASRMIKDKLIFYSPQVVGRYNYEEKKYDINTPSLYLYRNNDIQPVKSLFTGSEVYKPNSEMVGFPIYHSIISCHISNSSNTDCSAQTFLGTGQQEFYVSPDTAYLYLGQNKGGILYALSLDETGASGAAQINLSPFDQFSFSQNENTLSVFGSINDQSLCGNTDATLGLLDLPLDSFTADIPTVEKSNYTCLPAAADESYSWHILNRFSPDYLAYGSSNRLNLVNRTSKQISSLSLPFEELSRLELAGDFLLSFGVSRNDLDYKLGITSISLNKKPEIKDTEWLNQAFSSEWRSHGYSFKQGKAQGVFGLALLTQPGSNNGIVPLIYNSTASIGLFRIGLEGSLSILDPIDQIDFAEESQACTTSCIDWYGNSRLIFIQNHVIGLLGDQLTSGFLGDSGSFNIANHLNINTGETEFMDLLDF